MVLVPKPPLRSHDWDPGEELWLPDVGGERPLPPGQLSVVSPYAITARNHGPTPLIFLLVSQSLMVSTSQAVTVVSAVWFLSHSSIGSEQTTSLTLSHLQPAFWN